MATQSRNLYDADQYEALRSEFGGGESMGDHVRSVMDAATDDVKSVILPITDAVVETVRSTNRDVAFFLAGAVFTIVVVIIAQFF